MSTQASRAAAGKPFLFNEGLHTRKDGTAFSICWLRPADDDKPGYTQPGWYWCNSAEGANSWHGPFYTSDNAGLAALEQEAHA